jgi:D-alanyl-D-alanine carboxypeptidase.
MTFSERDLKILSLLYPKFKEQAKHFMKYCWKEGIPVRLTQGFRTFAEQDELKLKGVSRAKGGESFHNFGIAFDIAFGRFDSDKLTDPYKEPVPGAWEKCAKIGVRCGLVPGHYWTSFKDSPHYQANIKTSIDDLRKAFIKGGTYGLYALLDTREKESFYCLQALVH